MAEPPAAPKDKSRSHLQMNSTLRATQLQLGFCNSVVPYTISPADPAFFTLTLLLSFAINLPPLFHSSAPVYFVAVVQLHLLI
jgi:hypothetical protein